MKITLKIFLHKTFAPLSIKNFTRDILFICTAKNDSISIFLFLSTILPLKFAHIEPYFKHLYRKSRFEFKSKFKLGIKEYYKTEKPMSYIKGIFFVGSKLEKSFPENIQEIEKMLKVKNKKYKETFLNNFFKAKI